MRHRDSIIVVYYLVAHRYGINDVRARAEAMIHRRNIKPVNVCTCVLKKKYKDLYYHMCTEVNNGRSRMRTAAGIN